MITIRDNWYIDHNQNKWSTLLETLESAQIKSDSLINCNNCNNCNNCYSCNSCNSCNNCNNCNSCNNCYSCNSCNSCNNCNNCNSCNSCYNCDNCKRCYSCDNCDNCNSCNNCDNCNSCNNCKEYKSNPNRYITPIVGSRHSQTEMYWLENNIQIICGCWKSNLIEFEKRVKSVHKLEGHLLPYLHQIKIMKYLIRNTKE